MTERLTQPHKERDKHRDKKAQKGKLRAIQNAERATRDNREGRSQTSTEMQARDKHPETDRAREICPDLERQAGEVHSETQGGRDTEGTLTHGYGGVKTVGLGERQSQLHTPESLSPSPRHRAKEQRKSDADLAGSQLESPDAQWPHGSLRASESWLPRGCCGEDVPFLCMPGRCSEPSPRWAVQTCIRLPRSTRGGGDAHRQGVPSHPPSARLSLACREQTANRLCQLLAAQPAVALAGP